MTSEEKPKLIPIDHDSLTLTEKRIFNLTEDLKYLQNVSIIKIQDSLEDIKLTQKDNNKKLDYIIKYINHNRNIIIGIVIVGTLVLHYWK